ncbi:LOW QUALITY PROTEIN: immunoglobulin superfamily member 10, partial [Boleophthalmus pectinirostris]|uniref:LOW QUALITY PROTEIN: immunoglobulin superfamily member 10 n=1 Tax=Boleophthalmus pectinirostris TaxID=150288 RepID=UPI002430EABF
AAPCPRSCACPQPTELHCTFRSLVSVPHNIQPHVERINLGFNSISSLSEKSLSGLTRLELLLVHGNDLHSLPDGAFKDLSALQMLKLSYNKLREVSRHTFVGLWSLTRLHLDHNGLESLDPDTFHGLTNLKLLQLEGNRLKRLHPSTFTTFTLLGSDRFHLSTLKHLYLSNNSLSAVPGQVLETMPQLENLFLHGNPWVCDCNMRWIHTWVQTAPGVLKCKKDRALPGGQLCPICSSPRNLHQKPLQALDNMICSGPVINSKDQHSKPEETNHEFTFLDDFKQPFGNISLGLSDEHGNEVELECGVGEPKDGGKISFEQIDDAKMASNITLSLDLDCDVDREKYERLWRLIAYYTSVPAHLKRGIMLKKNPYPTYVYKQDSDKDALYYTGVKANVMALPSWLMQSYADLQLNRQGSSGKRVKLSFTTQLSQNLETEMIRREVRTWVTIEESNSSFKTAILGKSFDLQCHVQSSGEPVITWILPDGKKLVAPSDNSDERLSISADGKLEIKTAEHKDGGNYYCVAKVDEDIAILPVYVSIQDPSNPQPGDDEASPSIELLAGNSLNLDCNAFGSPDPEVNWIIPNGNIISFKSNTSRVLVFPNGTLHIAQSLPPDSGVYKCVVLNQYGVDTKTSKVTVNKRPGMVKPIRRFPLRPQSASGVNTKIKVPIPDLDEGSGETEDATDSKPVRKVVPVRNGTPPSSRTPWRRPPIIMRKPASQNPQNGRNILDSRRRMNMSKTKINPERWADILAKIRIKNGQFATTVSPVIATTPKITTPFQELTTSLQKETTSQQYTTQFLTTLSHETIEGSSDGVTLSEKAPHELTTTTMPTRENAYGSHTTTLKPMTSPNFPNLQATTSSNVFFLPQTTSRPFQVVKFWQEVLNTPGKSATYSHHEDSEVKGGRAADPRRAKAKGNRRNKSKISKFHRKVKTGQVLPTVDPVTSKREDEIIPQEPKDVGLLQIEAIIDLVSPTTAQIWKKPTSSTLQPTRRRNGNRKKNPNRHKNKINKHTKNNVITDEKVGQVSVMPTELEIEVPESLEPTVPRENESTASSGSQKLTESNTKTKINDNNVVQGSSPTAFPETRLDTVPSKPARTFTSHEPLPPVKPVSRPPMENALTERPSEKLRHAKRKLIQSRQRYTGPRGQKHLVNGTGEQLPRRSSSLASLTEHKAEEMHHFGDTGALLATTRIDFEIQAVTKRPENSSEALIQDNRLDNAENASVTASTTALMATTLNYDLTKMAAAEAKLKSTTKQAITVSSSTKTPRKQTESVTYSNILPPKTTLTTHLLTDTTKHATDISKSPENFNKDQKTQVILSQNANKQATSIPVILNVSQDQPSPTTSMSLQITNAKTTIAASTLPPPSVSVSTKNAKTTIPSSFFNVTTKQAPTTKVSPRNDDKKQDNETNTLMSSPNPVLKSTITPTMLTYTTRKVPSVTTSSKIVKEDEIIAAKPTNSSRISVQNSSLVPRLAINTTQQAVSVSVSPKLDQSTQAKSLTTSVAPTTDATQRPTRAKSALSDPVTQSPDHRMNQFISLNRSVPTINSETTPAPTFTPFRAKLWTEEAPRASTTSKPPALATYPRGKPRITKGNFQIMSVKAETDAILPCAANGEPKPFLSWTKVSTGTSIPQNTKLQRYEVHKNGTLIIRNIQPVDGGEYLCTVQNQYGSDEMLTNLVVLSQHPKILQPRHRDISVNLGSSVDLDCQVEGHPKPRVTWVLPNHAQMAATPFGLASNRVSILQNGTLRIVQAVFSDRGIYKCVGSSTSGADTVSIRLYVSSLPPIFQQTPIENVTASENGAVYLDCTASGSPQPTIRWITPDNIQLASSQYLIGQNLRVFPNGTLIIENLTQGNAGKYQCLASNVMGTSKRMVNLFVKSRMLMAKASITMASPKLTRVVYGGKLKLDCVAKGDPEPRVIWRMPSKKLVDAQYSFDPRIQVRANGSLTVHSVTDKDGGEYLCVARNKMGDDYVVLGVEVLTKPAKIEQKKPRSSQEVIYGGDLKVDCVASGLPNPEISWALPDGTMVNHEKQRDRAGRSRRYVVFDNGTLFFNDVGMREEGDYTCYAENQLGKDEMKIHVKVKSASSSPQIQNKTEISPVQVIYGENVTLQCHAKGDPNPTYTWISPMNRIIDSKEEKYQVFNNGTLTVQRVQRFDAGDYTCVARNSYGQDNKIVKVEVLVTPPVISNDGNNFKVSKFQNDRILLDCVATGTPNPRIMWVLPGNVILPAPYYSNRITVFQNGSLEIRSAKTSDSGQLACIARNEGGEVRLAVSLDVKDADARTQASGTQLDDVSLTAGNAMTLNCSFDGNNVKQITWVLPNGTPLLSGARLAKFFHRPDGSLIISNPSLAEAGTYRCLGRSSTSQVEQFVQLTPGRKPVIANKYESPVNVLNGDTLMLHCVTNGDPLRLTWTLPSGVVLNRPQKAGRYSVLQNGTLAIKQVSVYDRGLYACRAANEYGSSVMSVSVIVIAYPPRITNGPNSVTYAKRGVAIQLNCAATGIPKVEVAWETPDKARLVVTAQPRLFGNKYLQPQGSLVIQNPSLKDAGVYKCTARNAIGVDSKTTYLNVY